VVCERGGWQGYVQLGARRLRGMQWVLTKYDKVNIFSLFIHPLNPW
jgi:hypothetical protein